ncbi:MAG: hypothetical protein QOE41_3886 [Mycobacterium sp.]|nr:hypothetical protein [Mycobacterium sp.]MDT5134575.1 hypothetical protein [Mycobacterium sp.]
MTKYIDAAALQFVPECLAKRELDSVERKGSQAQRDENQVG